MQRLVSPSALNATHALDKVLTLKKRLKVGINGGLYLKAPQFDVSLEILTLTAPAILTLAQCYV